MQFSSENYGEYRFACIEGSFFGAMPRDVFSVAGALIQLARRR